MLKINWKVRFMSYQFWIALFGLGGMIITDLTTMNLGDYESYVNAILILLIASGIVNDPTVKGLSDSKQSLTYDKPKEEVK